MRKIYYHVFPIGQHTYLIGATENGLAFVGSRDQGPSELQQFYDCQFIEDETKTAPYATQISEYLSGQRKSFTMKTDITGTKFQEAVWQALLQIPYGTVTDYTAIAKTIGHPKASRAVGSAVGKNPLLMVIPCHRVLTKAGKIGGYRGGIAMKKDLLSLEHS